MLVLCRKPNERLHIGADIVVTVLGHKGKRVRIGIDAPMNVAVKRGEIYKPLDGYENPSQENRHAAGGS